MQTIFFTKQLKKKSLPLTITTNAISQIWPFVRQSLRRQKETCIVHRPQRNNAKGHSNSPEGLFRH